MKVLAHAKLNLNLSIVGKRENGYHEINSIMTNINIGDVVEVNLVKYTDVKVIMKNCPDIKLEENTAYVAACKFFEYFNLNNFGAEIKIQKNIPFMAGLGGSSADVAGVLYCLASLCGMNPFSDKMLDLASKCGSDVLPMLLGGCTKVTGCGESVVKLPFVVPTVFVVAVGEKCGTKKVYETYEKLDVPINTQASQNFLKTIKTTYADVLNQTAQNDLTEACCEAYPIQGQFMQRCAELVGQKPVLTGSGGAVYWACASEHAASNIIKKLRKNGISVFACSPVQNGVEVI